MSISDGCLQCGHSIIPTEDEGCVECESKSVVSCNAVKNVKLMCQHTSLSKQLMERN